MGSTEFDFVDIAHVKPEFIALQKNHYIKSCHQVGVLIYRFFRVLVIKIRYSSLKKHIWIQLYSSFRGSISDLNLIIYSKNKL